MYIDLDLTLIDIQGRLLPGVLETLPLLAQKYEMICWSAGGKEYGVEMLSKNRVSCFFSLVLEKPRFIVDDTPESILQRANIIEIKTKDSWSNLFEKIFKKPVF